MFYWVGNYFIGNDPNDWHTDVPNYTAIMYEEIYDGIDLKYYGNGKQMEYDFIVSPGADYSHIKIQYEGAESVKVNDNGELVVTTKWGEVIEQRPVIYQVENNYRVAVGGEYKLNGSNSFSFELEDYNKKLPLVIDPILSYSTYLGGTVQDDCLGFAVDSSGNAYITGWTNSTDFPTTSGAYDSTQTGSFNFDVFVTKINSDGSALIYSTFLGGDNAEAGWGITVDNSGNAYLTGRTRSTDFPTTAGTIQPALNGTNYDAFVRKLNSAGNGLIYSTFLGGTKDEESYGIAIDSFGNAYITGYTKSTDFPTTVGAFQTTLDGSNSDSYITKLNPSGTALIYGTYLGGVGSEIGYGITVDTSGNAYVVGLTNGSADFPTTVGAYKTTYDGSIDAFVTKFNPTGDSLIFSTYFGGNNSEHTRGIALDKFDNVYIAGHTASSDLPTTADAFQTVNSGGPYDGFMAKLNYVGTALDYCTYMGGPSASESMYGIALDSSANVYFAGNTSSPSFPTTAGAYQENYVGTSGDAFIVKFSDFLTDITEYDIDNVPSNFILSQNYPNPFNPTTTIEFNLPTKSNVTIYIYNLLGQQVQQLANQEFSAGNYKVTWDGTSSNGVQAATGMYLYRIETDNFVETKKMLLLK